MDTEFATGLSDLNLTLCNCSYSFTFFSKWLLWTWNACFQHHHFFKSPISMFKVFLNAYFFLTSVTFHLIAQRLCKPNSLYCCFFVCFLHLQIAWSQFTLCQFVPRKSFSAGMAAVLHMPVWDSLYVQHSIHLCSVV